MGFNTNKSNFSIPLPIIIIVCFLISLGLGVGLLWPKYEEIKNLQKDIKERNQELQSKEEYLLSLNKTKNELEKYEEELAKIDSALPNDSSLSSLFNFIQKVSFQSGLVFEELGSFTTLSSKEASDIKESQIDLVVAGSYISLKNFISTLEKSARLIEIERISFSSPLEKEAPFIFNLTIKVYSY